MKKRSLILTFFALAGAIIAVVIFHFSFKEAKRNKQIDQEIEKLRQEAGKIQANNQELQEKIAYFKTSDFQEKVAKEKLNLQKPDEQVVIVKPSPSYEIVEQESPNSQELEVAQNIPNYKKWWNYLFKY